MVFEALTLLERYHILAASSTIYRRVTIRSELSSLMANYSKIKKVKLLQSRIVIAIEGNWALEEWEDIKEIEKGIEKVKRDTEGKLNEDNMLKSKTTQDHHWKGVKGNCILGQTKQWCVSSQLYAKGPRYKGIALFPPQNCIMMLQSDLSLFKYY